MWQRHDATGLKASNRLVIYIRTQLSGLQRRPGGLSTYQNLVRHVHADSLTQGTAMLGSPTRLQAGDADPDSDEEWQQASQQAPRVPAAVECVQLAQRPQAQEAQARRAP